MHCKTQPNSQYLCLSNCLVFFQLLGVTEKNHSLAAWSLILYNLPLLSAYLLPEHWSSIAEIIIETLPYYSIGLNGYRMTDSVLLCLQAPWFQQLGLLHEHIVDGCLKCSASLLPKRHVCKYNLKIRQNFSLHCLFLGIFFVIYFIAGSKNSGVVY